MTGSKLRVLSRDTLKLLALICMTLGHWAPLYIGSLPLPMKRLILSVMYIAPPVFFFFIAEGYHYTSSPKRYAQRLLLFALITQLPHSLHVNEPFHIRHLLLEWNILMTLFLGLISLMLLHSGRKLPLRLVMIAGCMGLSCLLHAEWAVGGIAAIICFDIFRARPAARLAAYSAVMISAWLVTARGAVSWGSAVSFLLPSLLSGVIITFFYNGKKGRFPRVSKWFFYIWFPLHLLIYYVLYPR